MCRKCYRTPYGAFPPRSLWKIEFPDKRLCMSLCIVFSFENENHVSLLDWTNKALAVILYVYTRMKGSGRRENLIANFTFTISRFFFRIIHSIFNCMLYIFFFFARKKNCRRRFTDSWMRQVNLHSSTQHFPELSESRSWNSWNVTNGR